MQVLTFKYRLKDAHCCRRLNRMAKSINFVWNYCCETQRKAQDRRVGGGNGPWPSRFDLNNLTAGASTELGIHADSINEVCRVFVQSRNQHRRCPGFRASAGPKRALGWIPFRVRHGTKIVDDAFIYLRRRHRFWKSRELGGPIKSGAFVQDARGRWYVTFHCEVEEKLPTGANEIGIDLGLKTLATCSDGTVIPAPQNYRRYESALAAAQRAGNKKRVRAIHAKIANARRHQLHVESARIARENKLIVVGDVNAAQLKQTRMAKSVSDAGWSMFRNMLRYKASRHGARFVEADERRTSVTCSECGALSGPQGQKGLRVRRWDCSSCAAPHDRDVNSAKNILRVGLECQSPAGEIAA